MIGKLASADEIDKIAHGLYVADQIKNNQTVALSIDIFKISHIYLGDNKEFYDRAKVLLRSHKIKKIYDKNK